jgi:glyoxylase-like metal-dependent hydrolase (beta-lactamase superfamily II)
MFKYEIKDFFLNAKDESLKNALIRYNIAENISSPFIAVMLEYNDKMILIDSGTGFSTTPLIHKGQEIFIQGKLLELIAEEGIRKEDITDVILTHFHPDHIGGVFSSDGQINFPNATFYVHEDEWNFWHSSQSDAQPQMFNAYVEKNITPLKDFDLKIVKQDFEELIPGITMLNATGHTPGHFALIINHGSEKLLYAADAFLHPLHIERLDWQTAYDFDHEKAQKSRVKLLKLAYQEDMLVNAFHFDFPGLGKVDKHKNNWNWTYLKV